MGGNSQSKPEDVNLPCGHQKTNLEFVFTTNTGKNDASVKCCSTNNSQTPRNVLSDCFEELHEMTSLHSASPSESPRSVVKNKLFDDLKYDLNDPRSPSQFINRTPIVFDDSSMHGLSGIEASLCLNDRFSDLFINNKSTEEQYTSTAAKLSQRDPRSPTVGVDRTPILFSDDVDETDEIENVLEAIKYKLQVRNKPIERLGNFQRKCESDINKVYEDLDDLYSTPKKSDFSRAKRAPLSCVANKSHLRSRSVENPNKSKKSKFLLTSYDDNTLKSRKVSIENDENAFLNFN